MIPKFRGIRKDNDEMIKGQFLRVESFVETMKSMIVVEEVHDRHSVGVNVSGKRLACYEVIPETVSWCTGAQDANKRIIWGGDVIVSLDGLRKYVVMYNVERARWFLRGTDKTWDEQRLIGENINEIHNQRYMLWDSENE